MRLVSGWVVIVCSCLTFHQVSCYRLLHLQSFLAFWKSTPLQWWCVGWQDRELWIWLASYPALSPAFLACSSPLFFMQSKKAFLHEKSWGRSGNEASCDCSVHFSSDFTMYLQNLIIISPPPQINLHFTLISLFASLSSATGSLDGNPVIVPLMGATDEFLLRICTAAKIVQYLLTCSPAMETDTAGESCSLVPGFSSCNWRIWGSLGTRTF